MTPDDRRYVKTHEWIKVDGAVAVVGITEHAQAELGDVTFLELPKVGRKVRSGEPCCIIESVKAASDIHAPVDGRVLAVNEALQARPELVNESPYERGWIYQLADFDEKAVVGLLTAAGYEKEIAGGG